MSAKKGEAKKLTTPLLHHTNNRYVYYHNVISHGGYAVTSLLAKIVLLPAVQQEELFAQLARHLGRT